MTNNIKERDCFKELFNVLNLYRNGRVNAARDLFESLPKIFRKLVYVWTISAFKIGTDLDRSWRMNTQFGDVTLTVSLLEDIQEIIPEIATDGNVNGTNV